MASHLYRTVSTNHAFVGAVPRPPLQTGIYRGGSNSTFFRKTKKSNLQFKIALPNAPRPTFRTAFALPNAPRLRLQAQEYSINYNYKSNSQEYIQSIIKYTNSIHILINVLELAFQSHEGVGTEDYYLSQTLSHGRRLLRVQSGPI